ncbi:MAG: hypothetical protein GXX10_00680 [Clostridiaceae bacterium]|nr:hypothetical protein [Clostridiaceae bacterium]
MLDSPDMETVRSLLAKTLETFEKKALRAMRVLETRWPSWPYQKSTVNGLGLTNGLERLNEEIRGGERVIRIFPNRESSLRLMGVVHLEIDNKRAQGAILPDNLPANLAHSLEKSSPFILQRKETNNLQVYTQVPNVTALGHVS